jgi:surface antigen
MKTHSLIRLTGILMLALNLATSAFGQANTYPYPNANTGGVDPWSFYYRQCTSYCAWKLNELAGRTSSPWAFFNGMRSDVAGGGGRFSNANNWDDRARALGYTVSNVPARGAIAQWDTGEGYRNPRTGVDVGHVAFVESLNTDGSVQVSEYNFSAYSFTTRTVRAGRYIHIFTSPTPPMPAPSALYATVSDGRVDFWWLAEAGANCRIQVSTTSTGFTSTDGWTNSASASATVPVNATTASGYSSYIWTSGSPGSHTAPRAGQTYYYAVRQNTAVRGASAYSSPRAFTMPGTISPPALRVSSSNISRSVTQYSSPSASTFNIQNTGGGSLNWTVSSNSWWMSVSPAAGSNSDGTGTSVSVNFNTSSFGPQTLYGTLTVNAGTAGTWYIGVQVTITGGAATTDDHGNFTSNATNLWRYGSQSGRIEQAYDTDMFTIYLPSATWITITTSGSTDTTGTIYNEYGSQLVYNDDANGSTNFYINTYLPAGRYYLALRGYSYVTGSYSVSAY